MKFMGKHISISPDVGPNEGGFFCQVYSDPEMEHQADSFCIQAEDLQKQGILAPVMLFRSRRKDNIHFKR